MTDLLLLGILPAISSESLVLGCIGIGLGFAIYFYDDLSRTTLVVIIMCIGFFFSCPFWIRAGNTIPQESGIVREIMNDQVILTWTGVVEKVERFGESRVVVVTFKRENPYPDPKTRKPKYSLYSGIGAESDAFTKGDVVIASHYRFGNDEYELPTEVRIINKQTKAKPKSKGASE